MTPELKQLFMVTSTGREFYPWAPRAQDIDIEDIGHALAHLCRFGGHCKTFYSVAEHSVFVSELVPDEHRLAALLHDAAEAYVGDMVWPLKRGMFDYRAVEQKIWEVIAAKFGLSRFMPQAVKDADQVALLTERDSLLPKTGSAWQAEAEGYRALGGPMRHPWNPHDAKVNFLNRFWDLQRPASLRSPESYMSHSIDGDGQA